MYFNVKNYIIQLFICEFLGLNIKSKIREVKIIRKVHHHHGYHCPRPRCHHTRCQLFRLTSWGGTSYVAVLMSIFSYTSRQGMIKNTPENKDNKILIK